MRVGHVVWDTSAAAERVVELAALQRHRGIHAEVLLIEPGMPSRSAYRLQRYHSRRGVPIECLVGAPSKAMSTLSKLLTSLTSFDLVHVHGNSVLFEVLAMLRPLIGKPILRSGSNWQMAPQRFSLLSRLRRQSKAGTPAVVETTADENLPIEAVAKRQIDVYRRALGVPARSLMGVEIRTFDRDQAMSAIEARMERESRVHVGFVNAHSLNLVARNEHYKGALDRFLVLNDGLGINIASHIKYGRAFPDNLNGTDFVPFFLKTTRIRLRIYLIGTTDNAVSEAARKMSLRFPRHDFVGFRNGFFKGPEDIESTCANIRESGADCVLVGMGNPLQELWIDTHGEKTGARLLMGVGALLDFQAGCVRRAPSWVRRLHCEWGYRLLQEPRRLARRYLVGNVVFIGRAFLDARH